VDIISEMFTMKTESPTLKVNHTKLPSSPHLCVSHFDASAPFRLAQFSLVGRRAPVNTNTAAFAGNTVVTISWAHAAYGSASSYLIRNRYRKFGDVHIYRDGWHDRGKHGEGEEDERPLEHGDKGGTSSEVVGGELRMELMCVSHLYMKTIGLDPAHCQRRRVLSVFCLDQDR
jgi:hypothetical protein